MGATYHSTRDRECGYLPNSSSFLAQHGSEAFPDVMTMRTQLPINAAAARETAACRRCRSCKIYDTVIFGHLSRDRDLFKWSCDTSLDQQSIGHHPSGSPTCIAPSEHLISLLGTGDGTNTPTNAWCSNQACPAAQAARYTNNPRIRFIQRQDMDRLDLDCLAGNHHESHIGSVGDSVEEPAY